VNSNIRSKLSTRNYDPIMLEEIGNGNEAWILEDNPPCLNSEELEAFRTKLSELNIQCSSDGNVPCEISLTYIQLFAYIPSNLNW